MGDYEVPIYAQWAYGEGMVGSFMCDLNNVWSQDFMADENGRQFIRNAVNNLMPTESIRPKLMGFNLTEDMPLSLMRLHSFPRAEVSRETLEHLTVLAFLTLTKKTVRSFIIPTSLLIQTSAYTESWILNAASDLCKIIVESISFRE